MSSSATAAIAPVAADLPMLEETVGESRKRPVDDESAESPGLKKAKTAPIKVEKMNVEQPTEPIVKPKKKLNQVVHAAKLDPRVDVNIGSIFTKNTKMAVISSHPRQRTPLLIQFSGGGRLSPFSYDTTGLYGPQITLSLSNQDEIDNMKKIDTYFLEHFITHKSEWFAPDTDDALIKGNFRHFMPGERKKKKKDASEPDSYWPCNIKGSAKSETMESTDGKKPILQIVDHEGNCVPPEYMQEPGDWEMAVLEVRTNYTSGKFIGGTSARWRYVRLAERKNADDEFELSAPPSMTI